MTERGARLQQLKEQMNGVEDEVFRKFCREIGVANIRSATLEMSRDVGSENVTRRSAGTDNVKCGFIRYDTIEEFNVD